jgi:hypothetical protein
MSQSRDEINILELEPIINMDTFIENNNINNRIHYTTHIYFKNMQGSIKEYAILNYLNFDKFISVIYNKLKNDFNLESYNVYEIIPLSKKAEYGLELKEYLINEGINLENTTSKDILHDNKYYYVISHSEKEELLKKEQEETICIVKNECPVCYTNKILYRYYDCFHSICHECHIRWREHLGRTCPTCRSC